MTDPDDNTSTRPISVAELLARNGTIGAPPAGGRRRRRRGNSDAVTVAELTGEIPIISDDGAVTHHAASHAPARERIEEPAAVEPEPVVEPEPAVEPEPEAAVEPEPEAEAQPESEAEVLQDSVIAMELHEETEAPADGVSDAPADGVSDAEADYAAHLEQRDAEPDPVDFTAPHRRSQVATPAAFGAEQMSPDPVVDDDELVDLSPDVDFGDPLDKRDDRAERSPEAATYLRSNSDTLFGGQSVADDLARRGLQPGPEDIDLSDDETVRTTRARPDAKEGSAFVRGIWVVVQCVLAVAFGAGLFIGFDQLWRWNTIVALVLSVLVILGLVIGVRVVRKTEDIGSTLIAVAVGALVTLGPLALLQSH